MRGSRISSRAADALLSGHTPPGAAGPGQHALAHLVSAARGPAEAAELARQSSIVPSIVSAARAAHAQPVAVGTLAQFPRRRPSMKTLITAKTAVLTGALLFSGTGAAAAAGALPAPVQSSVASTLSSVGVHVPDPGNHGKHLGLDRSTTTTTGAPSATSLPGEQGLCQAWTEHNGTTSSTLTPSGKENDATAFKRLAAVAQANGESVDQFCASESTTTTTTAPSTPTTDAHGNSGDSNSGGGAANGDHGNSGNSGDRGNSGDSGNANPGSGSGSDHTTTANGGDNQTGGGSQGTGGDQSGQGHPGSGQGGSGHPGSGG